MLGWGQGWISVLKKVVGVSLLEKEDGALAGVAQWIECQACEPKGGWLDSQSGPMPGLQARSPVGGAREAGTR